ncbi:MAG: hypothetical protein M1834_008499 [Cirrosporium novae-zelandiae]|nr:MAG: hypothetical protein M1834_008499 [Cirrosporium novae-zelandiae]
MVSCIHVQWLQISEEKKQGNHSWLLTYGARLDQIIKGLPYPAEQHPTLIFFSGKKVKTEALQALYRDNNILRRRGHGIANLYIDQKSTSGIYPTLFADSNPDDKSVEAIHCDGCHEITQLRIPNGAEDLNYQDLVNAIHARLFFIFTDVLCLFADDYGGLTNTINQLQAWAQYSSSTLPVRPRVIIITSEINPGELAIESSPSFQRFFSSCKLLPLPHRNQLSRSSAYLPLQEAISKEADSARDARIRSHTLFSAVHFSALFDRAYKHIASIVDQPFDYIQACRERNIVTEDFTTHLNTFEQACLVNDISEEAFVTFIASVILLDSYPPHMPRKLLKTPTYFVSHDVINNFLTDLDPTAIFQQIYENFCLNAIHSHYPPVRAQVLCQSIKNRLVALFQRIEVGGRASEVHRENLQPWSASWAALKSTKTCFFCLRRSPEHILACEHGICDTCVRIFGVPQKGNPYCYDFTECILCMKQMDMSVNLKPPTAEPRLLCIDGGGTRGVVALEFLEALQQILNLPYPLQEHFDCAFGTSSGGLLVLKLFIQNSSVESCKSDFNKFAKRVFFQNFGWDRTFFGRFNRFVISLLSDSHYDPIIMERCLQENFGTNRRLFGVMTSKPSGTKVAVTATTITNAKLCLFTNYNGTGNRGADLGYKILRPENPADEIMVWEACTSAAPWYFSPYLSKFGPLQDGGLRCNNPIDIQLQEMFQIWPMDSKPDIVVSVGTGFSPQPISPKVPLIRGIFHDGFIPRLFRAWKWSPSMDGQISWNDHVNRLDEIMRNNHFRLNSALQGEEPGLDDVDRMEELRHSVTHYLFTHDDLYAVVRALWATAFYFELDDLPLFSRGTYRCYGSILSRSPDSHALINEMIRSFPAARFVTDDKITLGILNYQDGCETCGYFRKHVVFDIQHLDEDISIYLTLNNLFSRRISGFPHPISWFVQQQMLDTKFGTPDHQTIDLPLYRHCRCSSRCERAGRKRTISYDILPSSKRLRH